MARKRKVGIVVSDKMDKAALVRVDRIKEHPLYHKKYKVSKKFKVQDEKNLYKVGDIVEIEETRPISKDICWKVLGKAQK